MSFNGRRSVPHPVNEPIKSYAPGSPERAELKERLQAMASETADIPLVIDGQAVRTGHTDTVVMPHAHRHELGDYHVAGPNEVDHAIKSAVAAQKEWSSWAWEDRAAVFLRAAELLTTTWRSTLNAATMLGQSKTVFQAEIDSACELVDFWRYNPYFAEQLYSEQPVSDHTAWNQLEYRGLEGFVYAVTPFNFTAIGGNLPTAPALMGCAVVWKPSATAMLSAHYLLRLLEAAGLPPGVINMVAGDPAMISNAALSSPNLAGLHFTGSTAVFNAMWKTIGASMATYRSYPRIVGETGGKDFIVAHPSADPQALAVAIVRGAFEYQGQKCSAASRVYVAKSIWPDVRDRVVAMMQEIKVGDVRDFSNFMGAVIDRRAYEKIGGYVADARANATIVAGGTASDADGYFVAPTLVETADPCVPPLAGRDLRARRHGAPLRRCQVVRHAGAGEPDVLVCADGSRVRPRSQGRPRSGGPAAQRCRQLLHQRQAHGRRRRAAALWRIARVGHERQGRIEVEPCPLGLGAHGQGNVQRPDELQVPVHAGTLTYGPTGHRT